MKTNLVLLFMCSSAALAAPTKSRKPSQSVFTPAAFEKIELPSQPPEAIMFVHNRNDEGKDALAMNYTINNNVIRTRVIPSEIYLSLKTKLENEVFKLAQKDLGLPCSNRVTWVISTAKTKPAKNIPYCLDGKNGAGANFARWYDEAKHVLGF